MLRMVIGHSDDPDSHEAVGDVLAECLDALDGQVPQAGLLFAAIDFDHSTILHSIHQTFPDLSLVGCTTDGEMSSNLGFRQDSLTLILFVSTTISISTGIGHGVQQGAIAAAQQAVQQASESLSHPPKLCITLPASYNAPDNTTNGELILNGLDAALGSTVPIFGGLAGDQWRFQSSYQFYQTQVLTDSLPVLLMAGPITLSYGVGCGWKTIGPRAVVTKSEGAVLYRIGEQSALDFYRQYLGDRPPNQECPLAVYEQDRDEYYIRTPNLYNLENGSITFLGNIPEQVTVQLTEVDRDHLVTATEASMQSAMENYPYARPDAALLFSCCCRRWLLGTRAKEEYQQVSQRLPEDVAIAGFYTYGEFSPRPFNAQNHFHQETFVTLLIGAEPSS